MKRVNLAILAIAIIGVMALSACTSSKNEASSSSPAQTSTASAPTGNAQAADRVNPPGTFPIVDEKQTLKAFTLQIADVEDPATNDFVKWYEEKTNVKVDWEVVPQTGAKDKLAVTLAGGNLPDMFIVANITPSQLVSYGSQGVFLPLNDLIDKYAPNIKKMIEEKPYMKDYLYAPDGNIYGIPNVDEAYHVTFPKKLWIYKPWLDKLKLDVPTTLDEYYNVLKEFKKHYPDAFPLSGYDGPQNEPTSFFMQSFIYYDKNSFLRLNNDRVEFVADKPEYKEGLAYLRKLAKDGLIQPEAFTQDRQALTALGEHPGEPRLGSATALWYGHFTINLGESKRYENYVPVGPLANDNGFRLAYEQNYIQTPVYSFVLTKNTKNPEMAIRWADWFFDKDAMFEEGWSAQWGKEGIGWKKPDDPNAKSYTGGKALFEMLMPLGQLNNHRMTWAMPRFQYQELRDGELSVDGTDLESRVFRATADLYAPYPSIEQRVPFLFFPENELAQYGDILARITNIVNQYQLAFIFGNLDLDKDWDRYIRELENSDLKKYIEITQKGYDAKMQSQ